MLTYGTSHNRFHFKLSTPYSVQLSHRSPPCPQWRRLRPWGAREFSISTWTAVRKPSSFGLALCVSKAVGKGMGPTLKFWYAHLGGRRAEGESVATELGHPGNGSTA